MTTEATTEEDEALGPRDIAYDLACRMKMRTAGFAALIEAAFENTMYFHEAEREGIAQLAKDIAEKAEECFEAVRALPFDTEKGAVVLERVPATVFEEEPSL